MLKEISFFSAIGLDARDQMSESSSIPLLCDGEELLYQGSSIKKHDVMMLVMAFTLRFKLTAAATQALLDLLNAILPGCIASTLYVFEKLCGSNDQVETHYFCNDSSCCSYFGLQVPLECAQCKTVYNGNQKLCKDSFMLVLPLEGQLKDILLRDNNYDLFCNSKHYNRNSELAEVVDGGLYKNLVGQSSVTLQFNCDGAPVFNSSRFSIWPLLCGINEFPVAVRNNNIMLHTLWFGRDKPNVATYLQPFLNEITFLSSNGFIINDSATGMEKRITVSANLCICDAPARSLLQNFTQFNGQYGCGFCKHPGKRVHKGSGSVQVYPLTCLYEKRTHADTISLAEKATEVGTVIEGVKGANILMLYPNFDVISSFVPDYMHCALLGVTRQFLNLWTDRCNHSKPFFIKYTSRIDDVLKDVKPPDDIHRLPRSVTDRKFWKAAEYRNFLLIYSPIVLMHVLPLRFYKHWLLFVNGIRLLLELSISFSKLQQSKKCLMKFVTLVSELYGDEQVSYNVHILLHLPDAVADWGPLWSQSAFAYEDAIGKLKRLYHGTQRIPKQIFKYFSVSRSLKAFSPLLFNSSHDVVQLFKQFSSSHCFVSDATKVGCFVGLGRPVPGVLDTSQLCFVNELLNFDCSGLTVFFYSRFVINKQIFSTVSYSAKLKRNNSFVRLSNGCIGNILSCAAIIKECSCGQAECTCSKDIAIFVDCFDCMPMKPIRDNFVGSNLAGFIRQLNIGNATHIMCVKPTSIIEKCIFIKSNDQAYALNMPKTEIQ
jgi:hypothetical protein